MSRIIRLLLIILFFAGQAWSGSPAGGDLIFEIVRTDGEQVLWKSSARPGDRFTLDYHHSSDHTPVHDLFTIGSEGEITLIEESYLWYGAGLESHPDVGKTDFSGDWTRVRLHRLFPRFLLRVGEVADHVLTFRGRELRLLSISKGGDSLWIRAKKRVNNR